MPRTKNNVASRKKKRKILKMAKGYWGSRSNVFTIAKNHVEKGLTHAYNDRKLKKRTFRQIWIVRINAAARINGTTYSKLIHAMNEKGVTINRKVLANLATENPQAFADVVKFVMN
ncbi:MAG: 50S ribosomal protein L20 [Melioribacteraceae bacterium]|nr:50S ribosomal protein L20 [Melioribacteraceae bacterium]MCF8265698.1 50S ribosomal protein L20 [Melioribacteraceae bacterium]MCF8412804.1 50S ribosomal protein L20 [Melioribacteraceae bacterium]MCF8431703.1 50S ribosomal protein L20 [Melioribacteraceae bacterium]